MLWGSCASRGGIVNGAGDGRLRWRASLLLLVAGVAAYAYECWTGAGLTGWLMVWDIEWRGATTAGLWGTVTFFLYIGVPLVLAGLYAPQGKWKPGPWWGLIAGFGAVTLGILGLAGFAYWMGHKGPSLEATPVAWNVAEERTPTTGMTALNGFVQMGSALRYRESWSLSEGARGVDLRVLAPVTAYGWRQDQPVRYWVFVHDQKRRQIGPLEGLLLQESLPHYQRALLERRGVRFAEPYFVLYPNAYLASRGNWDALATMAGLVGLVLLVVWIVMAVPTIRENLSRRGGM